MELTMFEEEHMRLSSCPRKSKMSFGTNCGLLMIRAINVDERGISQTNVLEVGKKRSSGSATHVIGNLTQNLGVPFTNAVV
jgi:hypothetical protein